MKISSRGGRWTPEEDKVLRELALANGSPFDIAMQLKLRWLPSGRAPIGWAYRSGFFQASRGLVAGR
jgi:hypothetical protein